MRPCCLLIESNYFYCIAKNHGLLPSLEVELSDALF